MRHYGQAVEYASTTYRSHLEAETARFLDEAGVVYLYEPVTLRLALGRGQTTLYTPDFILPELGVVLECKGDLSDPSLAKPAALAHAIDALAYIAKQFMYAARSPMVVAMSRTGIRFYRPAAPNGMVALCGACGRLYWAPATRTPCAVCGGAAGAWMHGVTGDSGLEAVRRFYAASLVKE